MEPLKKKTLCRVNDVPVDVQPTFWLVLLSLWGLLSLLAGRRHPERSSGNRLLLGALSVLVLLPSDVGHAFAHTVSARLAGAPMDEILLSHNMPRTLYVDNSVSPRTHRVRALGGPVFNLLGLLASVLWRQAASPRSLAREMADLSCAGHAFILIGSLAPLSMVDGGVILKWTLVEAGYTPEDAEARVRRYAVLMGAGVAGVAAALLGWFTARLVRRRR